MKAQDSTDFSKINWSGIDKEKAEFIYNEAIARLDSIHKNIDGITNKALGMLTISIPIMTALVGFFVIRWGNISTALFATSICAIVFLFAILVVLLLILLPRGVNSAQGEPSTYFTDDYYLQNMENIYKGNIQTLQNYINGDRAVLNLRGNLFRAAVLLFASFPAITAIVAVMAARY
jgi:membrane protein implicated in regulation of membrane protease activity